MKKIANVLVLSLLITAFLIGCTSGNYSKAEKTKEELKAEIKAEMEAEEKKKKETEAELKLEQEAQETKKEGQQTETGSTAKNDLSKGYTYKVEGGTVKLTYKNTGNTITLVDTKNSGDEIINVNKSHNGLRLYFEKPADNTNTIHYVDLKTFEVKYFTDGVFVKNVGKSPYDNSIIINRPTMEGNNYFAYSSVGKELAELGSELEEDIVKQIAQAEDAKHAKSEEFNVGGRYNLKGYTNEKVNGTQINYNEYVGVIIPMYSGVNKDKLGSYRWDIGPGTTTIVNFAVFGKMQDIVITYQEGMGTAPQTIDAGIVENGNVTVWTNFPGDMSYINVTGTVMGGEGHENKISFSLDDMRGSSEYKPIMIKW